MVSPSIKNFLSVFLAITVLTVVFVKNANAASMNGTFLTDPVATPGYIDFDFKVDNLDNDESWGIYFEVYYGTPWPKSCAITPEFNFNVDDPDNSFGKTMHAKCDMGTIASQPVNIQMFNDGEQWGIGSGILLAERSFNYDAGTVDIGQIKFLSSEKLENGISFKFVVESGPRALPVTANFVVRGITPHWDGGTKYNCPSVTFGPWASPSTREITCDLSKLDPGTYTVDLVNGTNISSVFHSVSPITISDVELTGSTNVGNATNRNLFNINAARYSNAAATSFKLKVKKGSGYLDAPVYSRSFSSVGSFVFGALDYNSLPSGQWEIQLFDAADKPYNSVSITVEKTLLTNTCQCEVVTPTDSCSTNPTLFVNRQSCTQPTVATPVCVNPVLGSEATCSCTCDGTPYDSPDVPGGPISPDYDVTSLEKLFKTLQNVIIGIAVLSGVFIIPYAFVLMASGNPEKIKQGTEWLKSIFWGYLIIFLAGALIRIIGGEVLSFGF